jgi:hypothetical protein
MHQGPVTMGLRGIRSRRGVRSQNNVPSADGHEVVVNLVTKGHILGEIALSTAIHAQRIR